MNKKKFGRDWSKTMDKIREQNNKSNSGNSYKDERIYYPEFSSNGTAQALIRFLPSPDTDIPFVSTYSHSVKGPGGWYIENCPTTLKKECPVCKANSAIWDTDQETARKRKRKQNYYSNILVVKDPAHPENEGKVFLYRYGKKVHDKIMERINPGEDSIEEPVMVFDYYDGADFKLIIKKIRVGNLNMPNYDSCQFDNPSPIGTDDEIEKIDRSLYSLSEFVSADNFKEYGELESKFNRVVGAPNPAYTNQPTPAPSTTKPEQSNTKNETSEAIAEESTFEGSDDDFFNDLRNDEE